MSGNSFLSMLFGKTKTPITGSSNDENFFNLLREKEFSRLDKTGQVYLDYTGSNLYPESLIKEHQRYLQTGVYGNPHSVNPTSLQSEKFVHEARSKVLQFFKATDYYCIFTANASAALKIVGESYPFSSDSHFLLTADNHNSVNGIRDFCHNKGGEFTYVPMNEEDLSINKNILATELAKHQEITNKLFAFPGQSNVSGIKHDLSWINTAQEQGWDVLLDAAAFVPTSKLDLSEVKPDFVSMSFYKIFGYPTGIGCLLVKKSKLAKLQKPWYAGGTITISAVRYSSYFLKTDHEQFEDGTVNFLGIPAITKGFDFIESIGMENISRHIHFISELFLAQILQIKHDNGRRLIKLYGPANTKNRGGTFLINFFDNQGSLYPFQFVEEQANKVNISLRTGCFCNPGIDETNHCLSKAQLQSYFTSRQHGDYFDIIKFLGEMRGAIRVSTGIATTAKDINTFLDFAKTFLNKTTQQAMPSQATSDPIFTSN